MTATPAQWTIAHGRNEMLVPRFHPHVHSITDHLVSQYSSVCRIHSLTFERHLHVIDKIRHTRQVKAVRKVVRESPEP